MTLHVRCLPLTFKASPVTVTSVFSLTNILCSPFHSFFHSFTDEFILPYIHHPFVQFVVLFRSFVHSLIYLFFSFVCPFIQSFVNQLQLLKLLFELGQFVSLGQPEWRLPFVINVSLNHSCRMFGNFVLETYKCTQEFTVNNQSLFFKVCKNN